MKPPNSPDLLSRRAAGVLLHPTSLPGPHGVGDLGPAALRFINFLADAGQRWWQMLPIGPADSENSPYASPSALAISPMLISLEGLVQEGLLDRADAPPLRGAPREHVDFKSAARFRLPRLRKAAANALRWLAGELRGDFERFRGENGQWVEDFALFEALRGVHRGQPWVKWERGVRRRERAALERARKELREEIDFHRVLQFLADRQWRTLRRYAHQNGVALMGDIPIFVSHDSADVWSNPELFHLKPDGRSTVVSGCPPDLFSATGQLWGHPHYRWPAHVRTGFAWWIQRFRTTFERFDAVRIDHFLGFHRAWAVPAPAKTAMKGHYVLSPGRELFTAVRRELGKLAIVAEDLGAVTPEVHALRDELGLPGMRILQNGFGDRSRFDQPHNYPRNCVAYTGTHDNETLVGWFENATRFHNAARSAKGRNLTTRRGSATETVIGQDGLTRRERVLRYTDGTPRTIHWDMIRVLYQSHADLVVTPMQDLLGLDNTHRMNTPAATRRLAMATRPRNRQRRRSARTSMGPMSVARKARGMNTPLPVTLTGRSVRLEPLLIDHAYRAARNRTGRKHLDLAAARTSYGPRRRQAVDRGHARKASATARASPSRSSR